jgi:hypothetical protein
MAQNKRASSKIKKKVKINQKPWLIANKSFSFF